MKNEHDSRLTRIGVFYDGNYFLHVNDYYNYAHERRSRLSFPGLHEFIKNQVSQEENTDIRLCHIVDSHFFRGRISAGEASTARLYHERVFDDILMSEGIVTHYLPLKSRGGKKEEKGIDVWLALEAFELAYYKRFSVLVLVACDGDYVPLIRKLNTLGTRVMVLSWDFEYESESGRSMTTRTSQDLLEEATYPVAMHEIIDNRVKKIEPLINGLFMPKKTREEKSPSTPTTTSENSSQEGKIRSLNRGFGFIEYPNSTNSDIYFYHKDLIDVDFNDLEVGMKVEFTIGKNDKGDAAKNVKLLE
jgi:cold shock CspA family protein/uncharacterized LabA/DUF88 family protein